MNEQKEYQERFFNYLMSRKRPERVLNETMEVLNLRKGAVYKRINGDTALTTTELIKVAQHFGVSLDTALGNEKFVSFQHPFLENKTRIDFLDRLAIYLKPLGAREESSFTYLANELPIFYYFSHEYIFTFLLAIWNHLHWDNSRLVVTKNKYLDQRLEKMRSEISQYYFEQPVTEIWNSNMLGNLYQQVIFGITIRAFSEVSFIDNLIKDIENLINQLRNFALTGFKETEGSGKKAELKIYLNEFGNFLNMILYDSEKFSATFVGFDIPQFIVSYNKPYFDFAQEWVNKIRRRSVLISSEGYQYRELFFRKMEKDFEEFKNNAEKLVGIYYE